MLARLAGELASRQTWINSKTPSKENKIESGFNFVYQLHT